eukprot:jgi/Tetstr1/433740/TSEL_022959.t1
MVVQHKATDDEKSHSRTVSILICTLSPKISGSRNCTRLFGAPHLDGIERPVHKVWLRFPPFRRLTEADMWPRLAEGLIPAYDLPQLVGDAAADQLVATLADTLA